LRGKNKEWIFNSDHDLTLKPICRASSKRWPLADIRERKGGREGKNEGEEAGFK